MAGREVRQKGMNAVRKASLLQLLIEIQDLSAESIQRSLSRAESILTCPVAAQMDEQRLHAN